MTQNYNKYILENIELKKKVRLLHQYGMEESSSRWYCSVLQETILELEETIKEQKKVIDSYQKHYSRHTFKKTVV